MKRVLLLVCLLFILPTTANASTDKFGFIFPKLKPFTTPTNQQLADLAQSQLDPGDVANNNGTFPDETGAGFTYFGQFIDHDLTLDTLPQPDSPVDPRTLTNGRTLRFDLDSVYGGGPSVSPQLYDGDKFKVQDPNENGVPDLPRNPDGSAILIEHRNDENEIISQIHTAMLLAHNRLIDEGNSFREAQRILQQNYQWAIVHDFLPHIIGQKLTDNILDKGTKFYNGNNTPVEFSVAAYRFGHSQVRASYFINDDHVNKVVDVFNFDPTVDTLTGGRPLPGNHQIQWNYFFPELQDPEDTVDAGNANIGRKIDTLISASLFQLPIPGAEASGSNVLAFRNMLRAKFYGMASGQSVARRMGINPISPSKLNLGPGFETGTPLWYYILAESSIKKDGHILGPVGGRIVGEVFLKTLENDPRSYLNDPDFQPDPEIAGDDGLLTLSDLITFAGVANLSED